MYTSKALAWNDISTVTKSPKIFCKRKDRNNIWVGNELWYYLNESQLLSGHKTWKEFRNDKTKSVSANLRFHLTVTHCLYSITVYSNTLIYTVSPTTEIVALNLKWIENSAAAHLDVPDLLLLKLVYGLLQLPGGPCGVHGGSLELTFSLRGAQINTQHICYKTWDQHGRLWLKPLVKKQVSPLQFQSHLFQLSAKSSSDIDMLLQGGEIIAYATLTLVLDCIHII